MNRFSFIPIVLLSLLYLPVSAAEEKSASSAGKRIAMSLPHKKGGNAGRSAHKSVHAGKDEGVEAPGLEHLPAATQKALKSCSKAALEAKDTTIRKASELAHWVSKSMAPAHPNLTPVRSPALSSRDYVHISEPTSNEPMRQYLSPEGRLQTVVGR